MRYILLILLGLSMPAIADTHAASHSLHAIIAGLLMSQIFLIIFLLRSRAQKKLTTHKLHELNSAMLRHQVAATELEETQHYWCTIINSMPSVNIGVTHDGRITHWNTAAEKKTGLSAKQVIGEHIQDSYPNLPLNYSTVITRAIESRTPFVSQNLQEGLKDKMQYSDVTIYPILCEKIGGAVIRVDDVTMRVRVENMMIQNEKMLSLGELAAGIAHEINNPLSIILHGVQNIQRRLLSDLPANHEAATKNHTTLKNIQSYLADRDIPKALDAIKFAGERSASIVSNMLDFSRSPDVIHQYFDLAETINHSLELFATEREQHPKIHVDIPEHFPQIFGNAVEIQQVILNLVRNAAQALKYNTDDLGCIYIRASQTDEFIVIEVSDNGPGMQDEIARHIFEPFFTTKEIGQGTGLGLSVSYFIITDHHSGTIEVQSTPGEGTCFYIELPKY